MANIEMQNISLLQQLIGECLSFRSVFWFRVYRCYQCFKGRQFRCLSLFLFVSFSFLVDFTRFLPFGCLCVEENKKKAPSTEHQRNFERVSRKNQVQFEVSIVSLFFVCCFFCFVIFFGGENYKNRNLFQIMSMIQLYNFKC